MRGRFKLAWKALALAAALALGPSAEGFFHEGDYRRLELKRFDPAIVEKCTGGFLVFEEFEAEPHEPYLAVLRAPGFKEGSFEVTVRVRAEKGKNLAEYVGKIGPSSNSYFMVAQEAGGAFVCGLAHSAPSLFVDAKEKRIDLQGTAKGSGGPGNGGMVWGGGM